MKNAGWQTGYGRRMCTVFGGTRTSPNGAMALLLYGPDANGDECYILKSWGTKREYTIIRARTLSQMEVVRAGN